MQNISKNSIDHVMDMLKILADNEYSLLWSLVEDFTVNGHTVSVKRSTQWRHIIIDNRYYYLTDKTSITTHGKTFKNPMDYVRFILEMPVEKEEVA